MIYPAVNANVQDVAGINFLQARAARHYLNLPVELVADEIGITSSCLINIESGATPLEVIIAKALKSFYEGRKVEFTENCGVATKA